ncbi:hypothetical protein AcV7_010401 [Taiwanofungus camphoratus]|nr:hypothetical protein AcV7_010401 [Antrodia cinnamomea]
MMRVGLSAQSQVSLSERISIALELTKHAMAAFPTEIFELIIDVFWPNRQSLLACALTCRAWLPWSRFNICYDVQIANCDQLVAFLNLLRKEPHLGDIDHQVTPAFTPGKTHKCDHSEDR